MNKKIVYIVGGNGFARECYLNLLGMVAIDNTIQFGGFLGHGGYGHTVDYKTYQYLYLGEATNHKFKNDEYCIIGAGYPELRRKIYNDLKKMGCNFFTLSICSSMSASIEMGEGNILINSSFSCNLKLGNCNVFNGGVIVGHDAEIGDGNFFGPRSQILGNAKIGDFNQIGANVVLLPCCKVGNNNKIAPLSAVYKGCRDNSYWAGNPAVKVGKIE